MTQELCRLNVQRVRNLFAAAVGLILIAGLSAPAISEEPPRLFTEARSASLLEAQGLPMTERSFRARTTLVDRQAVRSAMRGGPELDIELFDDIEVRALLDRSQRLANGGSLWVGRPERDQSGSVVLVHRRGSTTGTIRVDERVFAIRPWQRGVHIVEEVNLDLLPSERGDFERARHEVVAESEVTAEDTASGGGVVAAADDEIRELTVLVLFTGGARRDAGGRQALVSLIELGVAETNLALENSNVNARFELVGVKKVAFKATSNASADLQMLRIDGDGVMDKAHTLREKFDADFVHLIAEDADPEICGRAFIPNVKAPDAASYAFGMTQTRCISPNYTFGHELGHNMGLAHDRGAGSRGQFRHSHGYCDPGGAFRSILAISSSCANRRVLHYSSPRERISGAPTGIKGKADNARSINKVLDELEAFRGPVSSPDAVIDSPQPSAESGPEPSPTEVPEVLSDPTSGSPDDHFREKLQRIDSER